MRKVNKREIRSWMKGAVKDHTDRRTGEVNSTSLAEEAATQFDLYEDDVEFTIPEWVFELSGEFVH